MDNGGIVVPVYAAIFIEAVIFYFDQFAVKRQFDWRQIGALLAGVLVAVLYGFDVYADLPALVPYVGNVMTGILFARVANYSHDVIKRVAT